MTSVLALTVSLYECRHTIVTEFDIAASLSFFLLIIKG